MTHRPLFDLAPDWDWATRDGAAVIDVLLQHPNVTVLYGHIHQEHHHMTGHIAHHAAKSLMFAVVVGVPMRTVMSSLARARERLIPIAGRQLPD